jgi:hypothetical protein
MIDHANKQCSRCHGIFNVAFFAKNRKVVFGLVYQTERSVCIGCQQTGRDRTKQENRFRDKARNCIRKHAERLCKKWECSTKEFADRYGWSIDNIEHDLKHAWENGCPSCRKSFRSMGHGISDMTLDIMDPTREPFYMNNVQIQCRTCNTAKGDRPPDQWAIVKIAWSEWERHQAQLAKDPWYGTLFQGVGSIQANA